MSDFVFDKGSVPVFLAPMAGITDRAFRRICNRHGADYTVSEMISAKALHFKDEKTSTLAMTGEEDGPTVLQLFGSEPEILAEAAEMLTNNSYAYCRSTGKPVAIDLNAGCPMKKIVSNGEGSALMKSPELIYRIVRAMKEATYLPVTVKMRTGWDNSDINAVECALAAQEGGASAVCIHGRTKEQLYSPPVDFETIAKVKKALKIPVIGNGGIASLNDARNMIENTGCDAIMIGQAAHGNPWLIGQIKAGLAGEAFSVPDNEEKYRLIIDHFNTLIAIKGEFSAVREFRNHLSHYVRGMRGAPAFRDEIN
ncbi:MAG: tRNA dihydrouridine synthase DusB, partial [Clostridia bacterium]|nr:tRNA dihydrouridine synthase DusB [Clostridia bacterium]